MNNVNSQWEIRKRQEAAFASSIVSGVAVAGDQTNLAKDTPYSRRAHRY